MEKFRRNEYEPLIKLDEKGSCNVTIDESITLSEDMKNTIINAANEFCNQFGITHTVHVMDIKECSSFHPVRNQNALALGESGTMYLNQDLLKTSKDISKTLRNVIRHELVHTLKPSYAECVVRDTPIEMNDGRGSVGYGYHGFNIMIETNREYQDRFNLFEEAFAEYMNAMGNKEYSTGALSYWGGGYFMRQLFGKELSDSKSLKFLIMLQNNDVEGFVAEILQKDSNKIGDQDILFVMQLFGAVNKSAHYYRSQGNVVQTVKEALGKLAVYKNR